eukprot:4672065-Amphidinium_carterae.1
MRCPTPHGEQVLLTSCGAVQVPIQLKHARPHSLLESESVMPTSHCQLWRMRRHFIKRHSACTRMLRTGISP